MAVTITNTAVVVATTTAEWNELVSRYNALTPAQKATITVVTAQKKMTVLETKTTTIPPS